MRPFALAGIALPLALFAAAPALAQAPAPLPPAAAETLPTVERDGLAAAFVAPPAPRWSLDLLVGLPTGLRAQRRLGESNLFIEGVAALYVVPPFVAIPMLGGGFRYSWAPLAGERDALCISPGLDLYLAYLLGSYWVGPGNSGAFFTADVDILWRHTYGRRCQGDLGVKLGAGTGVLGSRWGGLPVVGVFGGLRF